MAQRQFRSDDTDLWLDKFGSGSDGAGSINTSTDATANTSISATSGSTSATAGSGTGFAAGNLILIHQSRNGGAGAGNWELNKISSIGGGTNWTLAYATVQAYDTTAQVYLLKQYSSWTVNASQTLTASDWDGTKGGILAVLCNGAVSGTGTIDLSSKGYLGGVGAGNVNTSGGTGEGTSGARSGAGGGEDRRAANGNGGGGTNGFNGSGYVGNTAAGGGGGGNGAAGDAGMGGAQGGVAGAAAGNAGLTVAVFGGGGGGCDTDNSAPNGGDGGGLFIVIAKTIDFSGMTLISDNGGNGAQGSNNGYTNDPPKSGSGAGGSMLLKGQTINVGTAKLSAVGGTISGGASGGTGRIHADYLTSISGTTTPTIDSRQDTGLQDTTGAFLYNLL